MEGELVYNFILSKISPLEKLESIISNPIVIDNLEYVQTLKLYSGIKEWYFLLDQCGDIIRGGEVFVIDGKSRIDYSLGKELIRGIQLNKLGI